MSIFILIGTHHNIGIDIDFGLPAPPKAQNILMRFLAPNSTKNTKT